ncbi:MAG TPA: DUF3084 domain-containing protein [Negativicutes bacterium]|nr:DUF3084 domain-containing protein [Negativicutes bacterium]
MFGVTLILGIAITGGIIAFLGDRIGTRVGKRRMTLWGLRPRYTSIIITILTGILIAGSTLSVLTIISYDVRTALFGMEALKKQTRELSTEVDDRTEALKAARAELEKKNAEYIATNERIAAITKELQALQANKQALDERIASLNTSKEELQKDIDRLNELTANLRQGIATVRGGTIALRAGEVITVGVIQGGGARSDIDRRLADYLQAANQRLRERFNIQESKLDLIYISQTHAEEVVNFLQAKPEMIVLRLLSAGNVVVGEPIIGQFEAFPNRQIYAQGAVVLTERLTYSGEAKEAEQTMAVYLQRVNEAAVQQGIIPDPLQGTVGVVSVEQYYEAVNQLRRLKGPVELTALTTETVFSAGPLRIDITVRAVP